MIWPGRCCGWLQVWQLELYTGCLLSLVEAVVYPPPFWLGNLDHSSNPCSWGSGHVPPGCPPTGGSLDPLYVHCLW